LWALGLRVGYRQSMSLIASGMEVGSLTA
jgi:hypothetical protein